MEKIFESKSLKFIINAINTGMVEYQSLKSLEIISKSKPEFFIKIIDIDMTNYVTEIINITELKKEIDFCETNIFDYVVFGKTKNEEGLTTLIAIGLLELISISDKLITEENQTRIEENSNIDSIWSLDTEDWDLIEKN